VLVIGVISAIFGILYAVVESDIKRMLAFSSIENMGIILIGIGASMVFFSSGHLTLAALAAIAALYHLLNHSVFKSLLFMGAGSILFSSHTKNIEHLGGLIKKMPVSAVLILIGVLSISAMPPFSGFISEWLTFQSLLSSSGLNDNFAMIFMSISASILALTGALAAFCFLKMFGIGFLALPRSEHAKHAKEVNKPMLLGMSLLAIMSVLLGILPFHVLPVLGSIVQTFVGNATVFSFSSFGTFALPDRISVSTPLLLVMMLLLLLPLVFLYSYNKRKRSLYETWGCGQPISEARNEYTGTAFSKPVQMWFKNLFRPVRETDVTYSGSLYHKESERFEMKIEQVFEQYIYIPVVDFVLTKSRKMKNIQTGSIHAYLAYIFGTLIILFVYVIAGGS
jgi:hydrogenase-4 component B